MDKISVSILTQNKNNTNGKLSVYSISNTKKTHSEANSFNSQTLIKANIIKREQLLDTYMKYYNWCIEKIKIFNSRNQVDLLFNVPLFIPECPSYSPVKCIEFIDRKLKKLHFDTYQVNMNNLFITWKYLESNAHITDHI